MLLEFGVGEGGEGGVVGNQVDDPAPCADGQIVAEADDGLQAGTGDRSCGCRATSGMHHPVTVAVDDQGGDVDVAKFGGPVA